MSDFDSVWNLLDKFQFEIDSNLSICVMCILCNRFLADAFVGPCGCKFCKACLEAYLKSGAKKCPGDMDECKMVDLDIKENIIKIHGVDMQICNLFIKCPNDMCSYRGTISQICHHMKECNKRSFCCPFALIGCVKFNENNESVIEHLQLEMYYHNKILVDYVMSQKNDATIQEETIETQLEQSDVCDCKLWPPSIISDEFTQIEESPPESVISEKDNELSKSLTNPFPDNGKEKFVENSETNHSKRKSDIKLEKKVTHWSDNCKKQEKAIAQLKNAFKSQEKEIIELRYHRKDQEKKINKLKDDIEKCMKNISQLKNDKDKQQKDITVLENHRMFLERDIIKMKHHIVKQENQTFQTTEKHERGFFSFRKKKEKKDKVYVSENQEWQTVNKETNTSEIGIDCRITESQEENTTNSTDPTNPISKINDEKIVSENPMKTIATFRWDIAGMSHKRKNNIFMSSGSLYSTNENYEPNLWLYPGGCSGHLRTHACFHFILISHSKNMEITWSFNGRVTISMMNEYEANVRETITKNCKLSNIEHAMLFHFSYSDLEQKRILENDFVIIECIVETE